MGARLERSAYLHLLQRWKWTLLLAVWVAGLVGFLGASQIAPTYETSARLLVGPLNTDINTVRAAESLTLTYAELAGTEPPLRRVIDRLGLDVALADLSEAVEITATSATRILEIKVTDTDPARASDVANALADELIELTSTGLSRPEGELTLVDPAAVPIDAVGPNVLLLTTLSAIAGLLTAGLLGIAIEYVNNSLRGAEELAEVTGSAVLGEVNVGHGYRGTPMQPLVVEAEPGSRTALGYRMLASRLPIWEHDDKPLRSILVVGSQPGDQVGELTANLAAILARSGRSVTVIDADDIEAQVTGMFVPDRRTGLSELLALAPSAVTGADALDNVRVKRAPGIDLIPAGRTESRTVREDTVGALLATLAEGSEVVLVSAAPIHRSAQSLLWARHTDGAIVVARAETTRVDNVRHAVDSLRLIDASIIGSVLLVSRRSDGVRRRNPLGASLAAGEADGSVGSDRHAVGDKGVG